MTNASRLNRSIAVALLALLLSLRLIGAAGYMPAFEQGRLSIIVCPGADDNAPLAIASPHHHHDHSKHNHGTCLYAAAGALGALGANFGPLIEALIFAVALLLGSLLLPSPQLDLRVRPPSRGPPLPT
jgi:hypothetical protein